MPLRQMPIEHLRDGQYCDSVYLVRKRQVATTKAGKQYMNLTLSDKTGEIGARIFANVDVYSGLFSESDFIYVQARVQMYDGRLQMVIDALDRVSHSEINLPDFLPAAQRDPEEMLKHVRKILESITDKKLQKLCMMAISEKTYQQMWEKAPAGMMIHHAYLGGLLEHTLSVLLLLDFIASHYENIDRDMLLTGGLFHDIGKLFELEYQTTISYADEGKLIPHLVSGVELVEKLALQIDGFSEEKKLLLKHIILSHHGVLEFGSPVVPATLEAVIIHHVDNLDSKVAAFFRMLDQTPKTSMWSDRSFALGTAVRRTSDVTGKHYAYRLPGAAPSEPVKETLEILGQKVADPEGDESQQNDLFGKK